MGQAPRWNTELQTRPGTRKALTELDARINMNTAFALNVRSHGVKRQGVLNTVSGQQNVQDKKNVAIGYARYQFRVSDGSAIATSKFRDLEPDALLQDVGGSADISITSRDKKNRLKKLLRCR